ncbi:MAG: pyruvate flavodoxin/ferredoxin oxidoreductase domain-containing protein, 2-oxoglutarate ferredoxin oxidoreductase subunit alpha [Candidatus Gottesmanbacteria bacterium GW2011_GWA2_43_14]|uniref:Pyruvate flavodoxin/ferredoxin oxidoreductase domain-containing protein, 2-oxoglutarate ferredoxin oxidoreductase subunit alpha n=1 Tax=Candidatus Gottesmanbacteria bacterium GW2011_GWA2_43_14 TaxID=1618443 RepID=A0A0G1DEV6_9BACT|nr:MAG: pyruvate flavodoxin/ferredoxin oxidoreductase domain-containing protein, 2-oxoglutarate ferredoxin oxidoreductase subunit alpha [Candidatus Gottesmanbacteria bacterium GW2011_GWA2_43_14]
MIDFTVKIGGEAGFGIMTTGLFLGKIATRSGYHAFEYSEYPSLIRGGHNVIEVRISDALVHSQTSEVDVLLCLNKETFDLHAGEVREGGVIVFDNEKTDESLLKKPDRRISYVHIPFTRILRENQLATVMLNNIALGVLMQIIGADPDILNKLIAETFARKGEEVITKNQQAAALGLSEAKKDFPEGYKTKLVKINGVPEKVYLTGNEAFGLGAIMAGCRFYCAYPMTPTSALLHYLAAKAEKCGMVVKHAEDEIAVINMALGASWAGVRSMVGTSGGGFALMVEAVSLAGITETPIVIVMGQRPGPATGMPTWTEQGDLHFVIRSGHGEFPKIVLAPADSEEAVRLTVEAFNLADKYQTPVFVMGDKYMQEGHQSVDMEKISSLPSVINRGKLLSQEDLLKTGQYKRYLVTDDGISPRALPGMEGSLHQANSYEHNEEGHTSESASDRIQQVEKRNRKNDTYLAEDFRLPEVYGPKESPLTVISWGSMKGPILQALKETDGLFNYIHFSRLWPLDKAKLKAFLKGFRRFLLVENNSTAQLGQLLTMETAMEFPDTLLKYSGRPIYPEEVISKVREML